MQQYSFESESPAGGFGQEWEQELRGWGRMPAGRMIGGRGSRGAWGRQPRGRPLRGGPVRRRPPRPGRPRWRGGTFWAPPAVFAEPEPGPGQEGSEHVRWVQSTLNQVLGINLPVDGFMGPATRDAIRQFQRRQGLPVDGIVSPATERALGEAQARPEAPPRNGQATPPPAEQQELGAAGWQGEVNRSSSAYVRWVQESLNRILGLQLAVDGVSGPQTRSAIRSFQQRAGLTADGIVGPQTEAALVAAGAGQPPTGGTAPGRPGASTAVDTALPASGPGFYSTVAADRRYGTAQTIRALQAAGAAWQQAYPGGPRIGIGDISFRGGGPMPPHKSHDKGLDVDIRLPRNDGQEAPTRYQDASYSRALTQDLVHRIINNGVLRVQSILFNDPAVTSVRPWPGHDNHLHVRFYAP